MLGATDQSIPAIFTTTLALRVVLAVLESLPKRSLLPAQDKECSPEVTRGVVSTAAFGWLLPLLRTGYRKVFAVGDLYPVDDWLRSKPLHETLLEEWEKGRLSIGASFFPDRLGAKPVNAFYTSTQ